MDINSGAMFTGVGLIVVLVFLVAIIAIIVIVSAIRRNQKAAMEEQKPTKPTQNNASANVGTENDEDILAVLTAAAAYYLQQSQTGAPNTTGLVVRPFRRPGRASAWGKAGRSAQIYNKF